VAGSLPTSLSSFSHRRQRADSTTSFAYYNEEDEGDGMQSLLEEGAITDQDEVVLQLDDDDLAFRLRHEEEHSDGELGTDSSHEDYAMRRRSSTQSRSSVHARLLRTESGMSEASIRCHGRISQKLHMVNEDLTIVIAGFRTKKTGLALYILLCIGTLGIAYLLMRWIPRWQVKLIGEPCPLRECEWVVLEVGPPYHKSAKTPVNLIIRTNGARWSSSM
jgi:cation-transporting P-type ATPase 13A2